MSQVQLNDSTDESDSEELELPVLTMIENLLVSDAKKVQLQNATENDEQKHQLYRLVSWQTFLVCPEYFMNTGRQSTICTLQIS